MPRVRTGARLRLTIRVAPGRIGRVIPGISRKAAAPVESSEKKRLPIAALNAADNRMALNGSRRCR